MIKLFLGNPPPPEHNRDAYESRNVQCSQIGYYPVFLPAPSYKVCVMSDCEGYSVTSKQCGIEM